MTEDKEKKPDDAPAVKETKEAATIAFGGRKKRVSAPAEKLKDVEAHAAEAGLPAWELAALRQATGWADGRQVSRPEFTAAVDALRKRRQGTGRLA